jgi:hypothetical protein
MVQLINISCREVLMTAVLMYTKPASSSSEAAPADRPVEEDAHLSSDEHPVEAPVTPKLEPSLLSIILESCSIESLDDELEEEASSTTTPDDHVNEHGRTAAKALAPLFDLVSKTSPPPLQPVPSALATAVTDVPKNPPWLLGVIGLGAANAVMACVLTSLFEGLGTIVALTLLCMSVLGWEAQGGTRDLTRDRQAIEASHTCERTVLDVELDVYRQACTGLAESEPGASVADWRAIATAEVRALRHSTMVSVSSAASFMRADASRCEPVHELPIEATPSLEQLGAQAHAARILELSLRAARRLKSRRLALGFSSWSAHGWRHSEVRRRLRVCVACTQRLVGRSGVSVRWALGQWRLCTHRRLQALGQQKCSDMLKHARQSKEREELEAKARWDAEDSRDAVAADYAHSRAACVAARARQAKAEKAAEAAASRAVAAERTVQVLLIQLQAAEAATAAEASLLREQHELGMRSVEMARELASERTQRAVLETMLEAQREEVHAAQVAALEARAQAAEMQQLHAQLQVVLQSLPRDLQRAIFVAMSLNRVARSSSSTDASVDASVDVSVDASVDVDSSAKPPDIHRVAAAAPLGTLERSTSMGTPLTGPRQPQLQISPSFTPSFTPSSEEWIDVQDARERKLRWAHAQPQPDAEPSLVTWDAHSSDVLPPPPEGLLTSLLPVGREMLHSVSPAQWKRMLEKKMALQDRPCPSSTRQATVQDRPGLSSARQAISRQSIKQPLPLLPAVSPPSRLERLRRPSGRASSVSPNPRTRMATRSSLGTSPPKRVATAMPADSEPSPPAATLGQPSTSTSTTMVHAARAAALAAASWMPPGSKEPM